MVDTNAQTYLPVGPQTNVPVATVIGGGWTECYRDLYSNVSLPVNTVLANCSGSQLMLACRQTRSNTLTLLAQGSRSDVTFDTGENNNVTHIANGVGWYFNFIGGNDDDFGQNAWGFVRAGDSVEKNNCDVDSSGANDERLYWHLQDDIGGYRCGATEDLNDGEEGGDSFERIVYMPGAPTAQVPTLSEWGLIAMASILGIVGFMVIRRRKVAA
ncbi:MAG: IPTL-CTERM sorting domain-containing protein [Thermodesulfobacteriales bacterium]|nr:MAG: IPTL-CTERM sorting domain-containing protein [Thermodesulfobacteriales bacterium]